MSTIIYHEKQSKELCALHALNNLFQRGSAFSKEELDEICYNLAPKVWFNPHKSLIGRGNYDINVVMAALQNKDHQTIWFDKRKSVHRLKLDKILGFIMNIPNDYNLGYFRLPWQRRHWIAVRKIKDTFYNLDSKLKEPAVIGNDNELFIYLDQKLKECDTQLFVVLETDTKEWFSDAEEE